MLRGAITKHKIYRPTFRIEKSSRIDRIVGQMPGHFPSACNRRPNGYREFFHGIPVLPDLRSDEGSVTFLAQPLCRKERAMTQCRWIRRASLLAVLGAVGAVAGTARADPPVVTGIEWTTSPVGEKTAFLAGVVSIITGEHRLMKRDPSAISGTAIPMTMDALQGMTLADLEKQIDAYYQNNPDKISRPVGQVIYAELVLPRAKEAGLSGSSTQPMGAMLFPTEGHHGGQASIGAGYAGATISPYLDVK
jgi:hypothetical protein